MSFVVNVDFPPSTRSYTHRVGRTARGGANGTALSLVCQGSEKEMAVLAEVQASQPALPPMEGRQGGTRTGEGEGQQGAAKGRSLALPGSPSVHAM